MIKVPSCVAEKVSEQLDNIRRPPLWDLKIEGHGEYATIILRGKREGIVTAKKMIRAIEEKIEKEVTEEIPLDEFLLKMIKSDRQAWIDIVERCGDLPSQDTNGYPFVQTM